MFNLELAPSYLLPLSPQIPKKEYALGSAQPGYNLRHSFYNVGASTGSSLLMIDALLGHKDPKTTRQYTHIATDPAKQAAEKVAQSIADQMKVSGSNASR